MPRSGPVRECSDVLQSGRPRYRARSGSALLDENVSHPGLEPSGRRFPDRQYRRDQEKHPSGSRFDTSKFGEFPPVDKELGFTVVERLVALAERLGTTPSAIAIKWLLDRPGVTSVIIGVRRLEQLEANLAAVDLSLPQEELATIEALTAPPELYPNWMIRRQGRNRDF